MRETIYIGRPAGLPCQFVGDVPRIEIRDGHLCISFAERPALTIAAGSWTWITGDAALAEALSP